MEGLLGAGGTARVFGVRRGSQAAAVKVYGREQEGHVARAELAALRALQRAGVRAVAGLVAEPLEAGGRLFVPTERCRGSLAALIGSRCPPPALHRLASHLLRAVAALHRAGLTHGDIKPSNVLWSPQHGGVRITDFGLSFWSASEAAATESGTDPHMGALNPVSSRGYRAPEAETWTRLSLDERRAAVRGGRKQCGPLADAWSCGVLLLELFAGVRFWPSSLPAEPTGWDAAAAPDRWAQQDARATELLSQALASEIVSTSRVLCFG